MNPVNALAKRVLDCGEGGVLHVLPSDQPVDPRAILRVILEAVEDDAIVEYDCTMPVRYWDSCIEGNLQRHLLNTAFSPASQVIVLTEGKTDDDYIKKSLSLLFPDVSHMFNFFDYHSDAHPERSSSALAKLCNAIVSLNMQERFIFLFDNDAAGKEGLRRIPAHLPANMKAITLPDLPFAVSYPTIGPDGPSHSDINGRAVSIEFFLGNDALMRSDGSYCPVEWTGREGGVYQGKLEGNEKQNAQRIFEKAIEESLSNGKPSPDYDWERMIQLLTHIINTAASLKESRAIS